VRANLSDTTSSVLPWHGVLNFRIQNSVEQQYAHVCASMLVSLATEGVPALGHIIGESRVLVSATDRFSNQILKQGLSASQNSGDLGLHCDQNVSTNGRRRFQARVGNLVTQNDLDKILGVAEQTLIHDVKSTQYQQIGLDRTILYVAEIQTQGVVHQPKTSLAKIWQECLGRRAIPIDESARTEMIGIACKNRELKRHIQSWLQLKKENSRWAKIKLL